ncbi:GH25 family lysozyme [Brevibacillus laterosporus]|uniref:Uncharacterized protein n=1 Tax=Brevibacillus laterosporus TaxID=1465 RepID=A0A0F7C0M8_BRELA|nr:GH25 family lysozyme [Brevibacillus laterosporus]AKF95058.1 hypothetical protein EX87_15410 [Brevibacillus laterosporus]
MGSSFKSAPVVFLFSFLVAVQTVKELPCDLPLVLDIETDKGLTPAQITAFCLAFLNHVKGHTGKTPMIYTGAYFAK